MRAHYHYMDFPSPFGTFHIVWDPSDEKHPLRRIFLSAHAETSLNRMSRRYPDISFLASARIRNLGQLITSFLEGDPVSLEKIPLDLNRFSPFQAAVLKAERQVPAGNVTTYSRLAKFVNSPRAARAVGHALAENPFPLLIPCHRVVHSDGALGGYQGGSDMKMRLLERESVPFTPDGKVCMRAKALFLCPHKGLGK